jgi:transcriptional regulator of acetoin/glycerol metabolism
MTHDYKRNGTATLFAALNTLDGTVIMAQGGEVTVQDLPENIRPKAPAPRPTLDEMEQQAIISALCEAGGK